MSNVSDVRPWFKEDLARTLRAVYFSAKNGGLSGERLRGFVMCLGSLALMFGLAAGEVVEAEDVHFLEVRNDL